jgi:hypothetical protein
MAKTVTLTLPHNLTLVEAKARIQKGITDLRASHAARITQVEEQWNGNQLEFNLHAIGQQVTGRLDVLEQEIRLAVDLPWVLAMLAGKFRKLVEQEGRRMLEGPSKPITAPKP